MVSEEPRDHLWIPDEEVERVEHEPTGRNKPRNVIHTEHGQKLSASLQRILQSQEDTRSTSSLNPDMMVFKVELPEGEKMDNRTRADFLRGNGLEIRAVKNQRVAVVSTTAGAFAALRAKVERYASQARYQDFQYIDDFQPYAPSDKQTFSVRKRVQESPAAELDVQVMLMPNLPGTLYESILQKIRQTIIGVGRIPEDGVYYLTDGTPVIRSLLGAQAVQQLATDNAVYRIEETSFFSAFHLAEGLGSSPIPAIDLSNVDSLPIVVVLDSGVSFPGSLDRLVVQRWRPTDLAVVNPQHGTQVASRVAFRYDLATASGQALVPRARIIDAAVIDDRVSQDVLIRRLQAAVAELSPLSSVFNLSVNAEVPIEGDEMSIAGFEVDSLVRKYGVHIVVSSGNHHVWKTSPSLEDILDDDDAVIAEPADSMLSIAVGATVRSGHPKSISGPNEVAPYSRRGPGFAGSSKPDIVAYSANAFLDGAAIRPVIDPLSLSLRPDGSVIAEPGTSFSAPVVSGDLAVILSQLPVQDALLAKALLFHGARPLWDQEGISEEEKEIAARLYGRGLSDVERGLNSTASRVTFVRSGEMDRLTKERVRFYMPTILAAQPGRNTARVSVTCVAQPPFDRSKGTAYLGAYISASLYKVGSRSQLAPGNPSGSTGRRKWEVCYHFQELYSRFSAGDWQVWLQLHTRWDVPDDLKIPYALAVTIEDLSGQLDLHNEVLNEAQGRFVPLSQVTLPVRVRA